MIVMAVMTMLAAGGAAGETVQIGATAVTLTPPPGYCRPTGATDLAAAQLVAAADDSNVTLATYVRCDGGSLKDADYYLLKAPKSALLQTVTRPALLDELAKAMTLPQFTAPDGTTNEKIEESFEKLVGQRPQVEGTVTPLGRDEACVYMGGVLSFAVKETAYKRAISACITTANHKIISIYRYSPGVAGNVAKYLPSVKAVARGLAE